MVAFVRLLVALAVATSSVVGRAGVTVKDFWFGHQAAAPIDSTPVRSDEIWTIERGYGWEPGFAVEQRPHGVTGKDGFYFTTNLPHEGNYLVTVFLGGAEADATTTVKAELRRVMLQQIRSPGDEVLSQRFIVNVRSPRITAGNGIDAGWVALKSPRESTEEAWAWDGALTLEFNGLSPLIQRLVVESAPQVPTLFLLGDSTVCDQSREPYASWGQFLPRFFKPTLAVANHGESGETYRDALARRRLDKIISVMQRGDYLLMQFGHNDQKQIKAGTGGPFSTYADEMRQHIAAVKRVGGIPIVISPMERRGFTPDGVVIGSLTDYAAASAQVAEEEKVRFIDLNARSRVLYAALGEATSAAAFAAPNGKQDNTHHNNYGAWLVAACVLRDLVVVAPELSTHLREGLAVFDPAHPPAEAEVHVPVSPLVTATRPLGD